MADLTEEAQLSISTAGDPVHTEVSEISILFHTIAMSIVAKHPHQPNAIGACMAALSTTAGALYGLLICEGIEPDNRGKSRKVSESMARNFLEGIKVEKARQARTARQSGSVQ